MATTSQIHNYYQLIQALPSEPVLTAIPVPTFLKDFTLNKFDQNPANRALVDSKWETILSQACSNIGESSSDPALFTQAQKVSALFQELDQIIVAVDPHGIYPYGSNEAVAGEDMHNCLKHLMHGTPLEDFMSTSILSYLVGCGTHDQADTLLGAIKDALVRLFEKIAQDGREDDPILELFLGDMLSYYAFYCSDREKEIQVPRKIDGKWQLVAYNVKRIPLNSDWLGEVIDAIALTPKDKSSGASPMLLLKGSRGELSWFTDFTPGCSVGELLLWLGSDELDAWFAEMEEAFPGKMIEVFGKSLGGAMAYQIAARYPDRVRIYPSCAPGLFPRNFVLPAGQQIQGQGFIDPDDLVSLTGVFPEDVPLVKVIRGESEWFPAAHIRFYGGGPTILLRVNAVWENQRLIRQIVRVLHQIFSVPLSLFFLTIMLLHGVLNQITKLFHNVMAQSVEHAMPESVELELTELPKV